MIFQLKFREILRIKENTFFKRILLKNLWKPSIFVQKIGFLNTISSEKANKIFKILQTASLSGEDEDALVFYLELIVAITLENKDRLPLVWPHVRRHLEWLLSPRFGRCPVLVERAVVGLLRVANRNLFRDNTVSDDVLHSLSMLLRLSPKALFIFSRQIAFGLYELIRANAANVHKKEHWAVLFALLEAAGAAVLPDDYVMMTTTEKQQQSLRVGGDQQQQRMAYSDVEGASGRGGGAHEERAYTSEGEERRRGGYGTDMRKNAEICIKKSRNIARNREKNAFFVHFCAGIWSERAKNGWKCSLWAQKKIRSDSFWFFCQKLHILPEDPRNFSRKKYPRVQVEKFKILKENPGIKTFRVFEPKFGQKVIKMAPIFSDFWISTHFGAQNPKKSIFWAYFYLKIWKIGIFRIRSFFFWKSQISREKVLKISVLRQ